MNSLNWLLNLFLVKWCGHLENSMISTFLFIFFFTKFKVELLYDSVILLLGMYLKEVKEEALKDICIYAAVFTIAKW